MPNLLDPNMFPRFRESKVIFLNDKTVELLNGYKAHLRLYESGEKEEYGEIHVIITGKSFKSAKTLFDKLEEMDSNEIISSNE